MTTTTITTTTTTKNNNNSSDIFKTPPLGQYKIVRGF